MLANQMLLLWFLLNRTKLRLVRKTNEANALGCEIGPLLQTYLPILKVRIANSPLNLIFNESFYNFMEKN
jgi:hypothetical protein